MTNKTFEKSILSRPVYGTLSAVDAPAHLIVANDDGAEAILDMAAGVSADFLSKTHIIYVLENGDDKHLTALKALGAAQFYHGPSVSSMESRLKRTLLATHMGTQLYLAGTESLMSRVTRIAMEFGIDPRSIQTEHRGSMSRPVQCVHCKGITENVTTQPATCSHCGLLLLVRDHYSRRIGAFQGVCINAEEPDVIPEKEEVFP